VDDSNCKPITSIDGRPVYPCGLIANSLFNGKCWTHCDQLTDRYIPFRHIAQPIQSVFCVTVYLFADVADGAQSQVYNFTERNIAWSGLAKQYAVIALPARPFLRQIGRSNTQTIIRTDTPISRKTSISKFGCVSLHCPHSANYGRETIMRSWQRAHTEFSST
jgi:hypothetical protein